MKIKVPTKYADFILISVLSIASVFLCIIYILYPQIDRSMNGNNQIPSDMNVEIIKINAIKNTLNKLMDFDHATISDQIEKNIYPIESMEKKFSVNVDAVQINKEPAAKVNLIIEDLQNSKALINGKFYGLGDKIESGEEVVQITANTVSLRNTQKKIYQLRINKINLQPSKINDKDIK